MKTYTVTPTPIPTSSHQPMPSFKVMAENENDAHNKAREKCCDLGSMSRNDYEVRLDKSQPAKLTPLETELLEACDLVQRAWCGDGVEMSRAVDACLIAIKRAEEALNG